MKKILAILCVALVLAAGLWFFLNQSNGLIPADQIATLEITHHNTPTITATCDKVEQLRYLAGLMNKLELKSVDMPGIRPEFELTFRDSQGQIITQISVFNRYYLANESGAYTTDLRPDRDSVYFYLADLAKGRDIPVQNPDLPGIFLGSLCILIFVFFFGAICFIVQFLFCKYTGSVLLRWIPILASIGFCLYCFSDYNVFSVIFAIISIGMQWDSALPFYSILLAACLLCHILGWRTGHAARKENNVS